MVKWSACRLPLTTHYSLLTTHYIIPPMRLCRFGDNRLGLVRGDEVFDVTAALDALPAHRYPLPRHDPLVAQLAELRAGIAAAAERARPIPFATIDLLSPIANPGKIVAAP